MSSTARSSKVGAAEQPAHAGEERRVVVFSGRYAGSSAVEATESMARAYPAWRFLVVQEFPPRNVRRLLRAKLKRLRSEPLGYPLAFIRDRLGRARAPHRVSGTGSPTLPADLSRIGLANVEYHRCERLHDTATLDRVRVWKPWLGIALAAPILKPELFSIPSNGSVNLHMSLLPDYRGMPPGFWELHDGATHTGVTVHWIDEGLDTGRIIAQEEIPIPRYATVAGLQAVLDLNGGRTLLRALRQLDEGAAESRSQGQASTPTRSRPPYRVLRAVERACLRKRARPGSWLRDLMKHLVLGVFVFGWVPLRNAYRRARGEAHTAVLLYHRVNDAYLDTVTVGVEQFARQLRMLQRHYDVVDPAAWLQTRGQRAHRPRVVITFDDGYRDNLVGAMLLRRAGMPGVFFVSTRLMGTDRGFPHDLEQMGHAVPTLTWEDIARVAADGYLIGNHTADHANLGRVPLEEGIRQVVTARLDLEERLERAPAARWLAYPYGSRQDLSEELRRRLPDLAIDYCFSAYGGTNAPEYDRWNILRQGVDCSLSLLRLRAAVEGWRA